MTPPEFRERSALLDTLIRKEGRRPEDVRRTMTVLAICWRDQAELERRLDGMRGDVPMWGSVPAEELIADFQHTLKAFAGTPDELVSYIRGFAAAGVDEIMLQWFSMDDIEGWRYWRSMFSRPCLLIPGRTRLLDFS